MLRLVNCDRAFQQKLRQQLIFKHKNMATWKKGWAYAVSILLIVVLAGVISYPFVPAPTVEGYTLKENVRLIAYNAPIKVVFSQPMDQGSVERAFHIEPAITGKTEWRGNALMFYPDEQFKVGNKYAVYVEKEAKSLLQKQMEYDYEEYFEITGPPQILLFNPAPDSVNIGSDAKITVMFDRPMTALKSLDEGEIGALKMEFDPPIKGRYKWLGTSTISFIPERLQYSTRYNITIPNGTPSAEGGQTDKEFKFSFDTVKPELLLSSPYEMSRYNGPDTRVHLSFNQPMDIANANKLIKIYQYIGEDEKMKNLDADFGAIDFKSGGLENVWVEVNYDAGYQTIDDLKNDLDDEYADDFEMTDTEVNDLKNNLILTPKNRLPFNTVFAIYIDKDFKGAEGTYTMEADRTIPFKTVGEIKIVKTSPFDGAKLATDFNPETGSKYPAKLNWAEIEFSHPMEDILEENTVINIFPENKDADSGEVIKPTVSFEPAGVSMTIRHDFTPSTEYTITVKAGLNDRFGQKLADEYSYSFTTGPLAPDFELLSRSDISILDANKEPVYYVKSTNIDHLDFRFKKLTEDEFNALYSYGYVDSQSLMNLAGPFESFTRSIDEKFNEEVVTKIDLSAELGSALGSGLYYLDVSSPEVIRSYNNQKYVARQVFVVTSTALTIKYSLNEMMVWATDLKTGNPATGMDIKVSYKGAEILSGVTDTDGLARFDLPKRDGDDFYNSDYTVIGRSGDEFTIGHSTWSEGFSSWNFNIDSDLYQSRNYVYAYTDRPIYRPGHTVYFKGLVRKDLDAKFELPKDQKVHVTISDSQGETLLEEDFDLNENGTFNGELALGAQARTGSYFMVTSLPDTEGPEYLNKFYNYFRVAEYRKPDYELILESDKEEYANGDTAKVNVKGAYFFGAPMPGAKVEWTLKSQDYYFFIDSDSKSVYASKWYSFSDEGYFCYWGCEGDSGVVSTGKGNLDEKGETVLELPLNIDEKKLSQIYTLEVTAFDLNNQSVSNRLTMPVHAGEYYLGILNEDYVVGTGDSINFEIISVDYDGMPLGGKGAEVNFYKREWNTVKKKNVDGGFYYENSYDDKLVDTRFVTTNGEGNATVSFSANEGGSYKATVSGTDNKGNTVSASTSVYVSSSSFVNWGRDNNDMMELIADKLEYKPGETAHILVKSPYQNVWALVTQERGEILDTQVVKIGSNSETIDVPITEGSIPNVFVSVVLVKGSFNEAGLAEPPAGSNDERAVAAFKVGYTTLQVDNSSKELLIDVSTDLKRYHPGDEVTVKVKTADSSGAPVAANVSVSVVDKSVLSLTENVTADLLNAFYRKRLLGVNTAQNLSKAISRVNVQVEAGLKGGGGATPEKRGVFKDTAHFEASLDTNSNGDGEVTFKLPDNLTTWEILVIGITDDTLVGSKKYEFLVTKDVLVRPVLPRFLIVDDTMKVGGIVHNYMDKEMMFTVDLNVSGVEFMSADKKQTSQKVITLKSGAEQKVEWDIKVLNNEEAVFTYDVRAFNDESIGDILEQKLPISPFGFPEVTATSLTIDDSNKHIETVWLPLGVDQNFGKLSVRVSSTLTASLSQGLEYLMRFPYGCAEQTASALLPNVVLKQVLDLPAIGNDLVNEDELKKNVEGGLQALYKYQQSSGGWGLWETSQATPYLTSYVLFTLNETKKAGYTVDDDVMNRAKDYLKRQMSDNSLSNNNDIRYQANSRAFALYVLAETGDPDLGMTNNLFEYKDNLNLFSKAYLAMTFATLKEQGSLDVLDGSALGVDFNGKIETLKNEILNKAKETPRGVHFEESERLYSLFDTNTRTTALVLQMLSRIEPNHPYIPKILRHMMLEKKNGHFASTQETAVSLLAMVEYLKSSGELQPSYNGIVSVNGVEKINESFTEENISEEFLAEMALTELMPNNQDNELAFVRNGNGKMYVDVNYEYFLPTEEIKARDEGILVTHEYYHVDDKDLESPVDRVKLGENLRARVNIVVPDDRYYVMVEDFLPSGLEGVDFTLKTSNQSLDESLNENKDPYSWDDSSWFFNYSEVRDDRMMYFADYLPKGVYELDYFVRATTPGMFRDKPVLAQELYFPEVFGRSEGNMFEVFE